MTKTQSAFFALIVTALCFGAAAFAVLLVDRQAPAPANLGGDATESNAFYATAPPDTGTATSSSDTVATGASSRIAATSTSAQWRMIQNNSACTVYLRFGADKAAAASSGIMLSASTTLQFALTQGNMYRGSVQAIAAGCNANVLVNQY